MDYSKLAFELIANMQLLYKAGTHRNIDESLRGETFVLHYLASHGGEVLPGEISNEMKVSSARIAQTLNSIEKKGWITRQIDPNDRRRILVGLTPEGRDAAEEQRKTVIEKTSEMLKLFGEYDAQEYVRLTGKLVDILSKYK